MKKCDVYSHCRTDKLFIMCTVTIVMTAWAKMKENFTAAWFSLCGFEVKSEACGERKFP